MFKFIQNRKQRKQDKLEEARLKAIEEQRERELRARISVKKTLSAMKKQSAKLEDFKKDYIDKARRASLIGNKQTYNLAKSGLKLCLSKQRFLDTMVSNFEISLQISDMNKVISEFVDGMNTISDQMKNVTSSLDMTKAQLAYEKALANNAGQYEAFDAFLSTAADSIGEFEGLTDEISDEEIDKLITNQVLDSEDNLDKDIEEKITDIRQKINE